MRAAPAHSSAVSAPPIVPDQAQPRKNGAASENTANSGNSRLMIATSLSPHEVGREALGRGGVHPEEPADVRVREAAQRAGDALAVVHVRRVRIAGTVAEHVVAAMVRDPADQRALHRERSRARQRDLERAARLEAAVGEQAVVADGHAEAAEQVEADGEHDVVEVHDAAPEQRDGDAEGDRRADHEERR